MKRSDVRLVVAIAVSLILHLALLMLQFGEYGEGLPGFELPLGDRRAHSPELHLNLQNPVTPTAISAPEKSIDQSRLTPVKNITPDVSTVPPGFALVPLNIAPQPIEPAEKSPPLISQVAAHSIYTKPELITTTDAHSDFNVPEPEPARTEPSVTKEASTENRTEEEIVPTAELPLQSAPVDDSEDKAKEAADKLAKQRQDEELRQKQMIETQQADAQKEIEKRREQLAALQNEKLKQEELVRQQAAREKIERANLLAEQERIEQRKLAEAVREQKARQEQASREQIERDQAEQQKQEQLKLEQLRQEQLRQEQLRQEQLRQEQLRQEQLRQEQLRQEQLRQEQLRQEQLRQKQQQETERQLQLDQARAQAEAKTRSEQSRSQANDLDELLGTASNHGTGAGAKPDMDKLLSGRAADFDKNGSARSSSIGTTLPVPHSETPSGVKQSIFGSRNGDVDLNLYIKSWRQKVERNGRLNYAQSSKDHIHTDPIVTVSIRSDGSVESITISRSSGRADIDEAVRRIVTVNAPYSAFPPGLARKFDVIDIRQIWIFDEALHVTDEMR